MPSELSGRPSTGPNAFVPEDWATMPPGRRRAYVSHLIGVREKLHGLLHVSDDGEGLRSVVEEVEAALAALRVEGSPSGQAEGEADPAPGHDVRYRRGSSPPSSPSRT